MVQKWHSTVYVLAMVGHLKNVSPTLVQMPNRITNVEFISQPHYCHYDVVRSFLFSN